MNDTKNAMKETLSQTSSVDIYQITGVDVEDQTYTIKQLNFNKSFDKVPIMGLGLGHGKGQLMLLSENDLVLVVFLAGSLTPYILGSIFNTFMSEPDTKIPILENEYFIGAQTNGPYIHIKEDKSININGVINVKQSDTNQYEPGVLGYTDANWGFIFRPPHAAASASHLFVNYANGFLLKLNEDQSANFYGAVTVAGTLKVGAYTLPATDGTAGQVLKTNGSGVLYWAADNV